MIRSALFSFCKDYELEKYNQHVLGKTSEIPKVSPKGRSKHETKK